MLVKQGAKKASVLLFLKGEKNLFFISRTLTLTKTGATHKVEAGTTPIEGASPDWYTDKKKYASLADGGVTDTQAAISSIVGATYKSLKATNFMFQKDKSPFIEADSGSRKAILGEILGFEPMAKAFKALDGKRLVAQQALKERKAELEGLKSAIDPVKEKQVADDLTSTEVKMPGLKSKVDILTMDADRAKLLVDGATALLEKANEQLLAMPNSDDALSAAEDALNVLETTFTTERERRVRVYTADKDQISKLKAEVVATDITALTARAEALTTAKTECQRTIDEVQPEIDRHTAAKTTAYAKLEGLDKENAEFGRQITSLETDNIDKCSKCGAKVDSAHIKKEIAELRSQSVANRVAVGPHNLAIQDADKELTSLVDRKRVAERDSRAAVAEMETVVSKVAGVKGKIEELERLVVRFAETEKQGKDAKTEFEEKKKVSEQKIADLKSKVEQEVKNRAKNEEVKNGIVEDLKMKSGASHLAAMALSDAKISLATAQTALDGLRTALVGFAETRTKVEAKEAAVVAGTSDLELRAMACEVLDPKAGLPVWLIDARIPELEDGINRYMDIFGAGGLSVRLRTVDDEGKESLDVLVDNGEEPVLDVAAYSGGQLDRIEVCLKLALADLAESMRDVRLGLLAYDEPGVHLDEERKTKLVEMIHERCASGRTPVAIVISHDRKLMSGFRRRLAVSKTDDETELIAA
jgi:DNA repair exonuclease SbcCD ATPase subunit